MAPRRAPTDGRSLGCRGHCVRGGSPETAYTSSGHRYLFRAFDESAAGPVAGPGTQLLTSIDHLVRGLLRSELAGKLARAAFAFLPHLDRLIPTEFAMDNASAYYFLVRGSEQELSRQDIVRCYRGAQTRSRRSGDS